MKEVPKPGQPWLTTAFCLFTLHSHSVVIAYILFSHPLQQDGDLAMHQRQQEVRAEGIWEAVVMRRRSAGRVPRSTKARPQKSEPTPMLTDVWLNTVTWDRFHNIVQQFITDWAPWSNTMKMSPTPETRPNIWTGCFNKMYFASHGSRY